MVIIVMGVAGAGKTTIGRQLAGELQWRFCDGDALHPPKNIQKMRQGRPLNDDDRRPWLGRIREALAEWITHDEQAVLACSLLKEAYREFVSKGYQENVEFVYLKASHSLLQQRLRHRTGHFMAETLLDSQLQILEEPPDALVLDASASPVTIVQRIRAGLHV